MVVKDTNNPEAGFSLIELMISLAIFGVVLAGIVAMFTSTGRYHTGQEMMVEVAQNLRSTRNLMVDEIRSAGCNPKEQGRMGFMNASGVVPVDTNANSIHFTRDIDNGDGDAFYESDGDDDDPNEDIGYELIGTTLVRNTGGGGQPVMDNVTDLQFQYYDKAGTLVTSLASNSDLDKIKSVEVTITGQVQNTDRVSTDNQTWTQQFQILVRNR